MSHYDREADIVALDLEGFDGRRAYGEQVEWGVILRDRDSERVVSVEFHAASKRLPPDLLAALPEPAAEPIVFERQPA